METVLLWKAIVGTIVAMLFGGCMGWTIAEGNRYWDEQDKLTKM